MLNYELLGEIFSYRDKTWVALNPLILPVGQELELDLEPKRGRGGKINTGIRNSKVGPSSRLPSPAQPGSRPMGQAVARVAPRHPSQEGHPAWGCQAG